MQRQLYSDFNRNFYLYTDRMEGCYWPYSVVEVCPCMFSFLLQQMMLCVTKFLCNVLCLRILFLLLRQPTVMVA